MKKILLYSGIILLLVACSKNEKLIPLEDKGFVVPENFPAPIYNFTQNPYSKEKRELGRKLFYDVRLSRDNTISCGSCHQQTAAFAHADHRVSHGIDNLLGTRNSPALFNLAWQSLFFWDGGVGDLDLFHINPIQNPVEMDESVGNVLLKLKADAAYSEMFKQAFGNSEITSVRFFHALSIFMISLQSYQSKYDEYLKGNLNILSNTEKEGLALFNAKCASCHSGVLFTDFSFRNNGLTASSDLGRFRVSALAEDSFKFKVPSLRNIEFSSPYMHNGRFNTLEEVLNHYSDGVIRNSSTLDSNLQHGSILGIPMTIDEKSKIIAFLKTLTDQSFIRDKRFSEF